MYFDDILKQIGEFGLYQKKLYFVLCLQPVASGLLQLLSIFTLASPDHRCAIPGYDNDTFSPQDENHRELINSSIPESSKCFLQNTTIDIYGNISIVQYKCNSWVYDTTTFTSTLVTEFDLVCDNSVKKSNAVMLLFLGLLVGYGVMGNVADFIGRKPLMVVSNYLCCICSYLTVWSPNYIFLLAMRFCMGLGMAGQSLAIYIIGVELVGPSKRRFTGILSNFYWCFGMILMSVLGYFIRDWRYLRLAVSVYTTVLLTFVCLIPESPRWLLTRGYNAKAHALIQKAAEVNKVELDDETLKKLCVSDKVTKLRFWKIFTSKTLCVRTLVCYTCWFAASITYFGIILNLELLVGNIYLNLFVASILEVVCYLLVFLLLDRLGRKNLMCICMLMGVLSLTAAVFVIMYTPENLKWLMTVCALVGQFGVTCVFAILWLYTGELFPTELRNIGTGTSSAMARVASLAAPYFGLISSFLTGPMKETAPFILYAGVCLVALILAFCLLPDTSKKRLPETILDTIHFTEEKSIESFCSSSESGSGSGKELLPVKKNDNLII
ncbi:hypothetical protein LOTGIDRAFT_235707 [Lottia gigantea]|uniref:Major facilitator superfamily (MFS) profile domain-containing protein n=1 Tax=Lottia gigantea TaxID=225164 RepID=V4B9S1_LOTGI|nr:hypothetical protein LOTGIDRAFT_235707 [Lottia gigantea]ESO85734.1 hypothetical protein LOTGIDRAFT_235707 [Lottia gigantea]